MRLGSSHVYFQLADESIRNKRIYVTIFFFFFQAEDGIRDDLVTGVQTCALPIWRPARRWRARSVSWLGPAPPDRRLLRRSPPREAPEGAVVQGIRRLFDCARTRSRSEERRVGKECRYRWSPESLKKRRNKYTIRQ